MRFPDHDGKTQTDPENILIILSRRSIDVDISLPFNGTNRRFPFFIRSTSNRGHERSKSTRCRSSASSSFFRHPVLRARRTKLGKCSRFASNPCLRRKESAAKKKFPPQAITHRHTADSSLIEYENEPGVVKAHQDDAQSGDDRRPRQHDECFRDRRADSWFVRHRVRHQRSSGRDEPREQARTEDQGRMETDGTQTTTGIAACLSKATAD